MLAFPTSLSADNPAPADGTHLPESDLTASDCMKPTLLTGGSLYV